MSPETRSPGEAFADWKAPGSESHLKLVKNNENPLKEVSDDDIDALLEAELPTTDEDLHQGAVFESRALQEQYKKENFTIKYNCRL